jgi:D-alanyl-D-alanine dipeptidase
MGWGFNEPGAGAAMATPDLAPETRANRRLLAEAVGAAGFVNYPHEWWHWSYGDRYWALATGSPFAIYGPH